MDKNLTYQKARRIRGTSITSLLADQLLYEPTIGKAIKKTISLKTQSSIKGIKEKFDPLNIVKFLTLGSKLGPALYGKLAGRDIRDIEYFTGRNRPLRVGAGRSTASRIGPMPDQGADIGGINEQLIKIYRFLKTSGEQDAKRREKEENFAEERQLESEKQHDRFIKELRKIMSQFRDTATRVDEYEDETTPNIGFDLPGRRGTTGKPKASDLRKSRQAKVRMAKIGRFAKSAGRFLVNPVTITAAAIAGAGYLTAEAIQYYAETEKGIKSQINVAEEEKSNLQRQLDIIEKTDKSMFTPQQIAEGRTSDPRKKQYKERINQADERIKELQDQLKNLLQEKNSATPDESDAETARLTRQNDAAAAATSTTGSTGNTPSVTPTNSSMLPTSESSKLNNLMAENVSSNLPSKPYTQSQNIINNNTQKISNNIQLDSLDQIAVHNDEPTFMRMIMGSTRVV